MQGTAGREEEKNLYRLGEDEALGPGKSQERREHSKKHCWGVEL